MHSTGVFNGSLETSPLTTRQPTIVDEKNNTSKKNKSSFFIQ